MSESDFHPNWASPPGETIRKLQLKSDLSTPELASKLGLTVNETTSMIAGVTAMSPIVAAQLSMVFGGTAEYWNKREEQFRTDVSRLPIGHRYDKSWLRSIAYQELAKLGWVGQKRSDDEQAEEALRFFGVRNSDQWRLKYSPSLLGSAFRASPAFETRYESVAAWLRQGERVASSIDCAEWNPGAFREKLLEVRRLTKNKHPAQFVQTLRRICADCGVALVIARTPPGCHASGATQFLTQKKALLMLSFRYKTDDHFWFSFFHEAGHLLLHPIDDLFIDESFTNEVESAEETEANQFAQDLLIPREQQSEMLSLKARRDDVLRFAIRSGIAPGIVVGQLQNSGVFGRQQLNWLKRRFDETEIDEAINL